MRMERRTKEVSGWERSLRRESLNGMVRKFGEGGMGMGKGRSYNMLKE